MRRNPERFCHVKFRKVPIIPSTLFTRAYFEMLYLALTMFLGTRLSRQSADFSTVVVTRSVFPGRPLQVPRFVNYEIGRESSYDETMIFQLDEDFEAQSNKFPCSPRRKGVGTSDTKSTRSRSASSSGTVSQPCVLSAPDIDNEEGLFLRSRWSFGSGHESGDDDLRVAVRMSPSFQASIEDWVRPGRPKGRSSPDDPFGSRSSLRTSGSPPVSRNDLELLRSLVPPPASNEPLSRSLPMTSSIPAMRGENIPSLRLPPSAVLKLGITSDSPRRTSILRGYNSDGDT